MKLQLTITEDILLMGLILVQLKNSHSDFYLVFVIGVTFYLLSKKKKGEASDKDNKHQN